MTKIKICGLTRPEDIMAVNRWNPDFIGFVFAESRRKVSWEQAAELKKKLRPDICAVGVFVNGRAKEEAELFRAGIIDLIQLHGQETEAHILELKERTEGKVPIIKAVRMDREAAAQELARQQEGAADYLLLDNGPGGTGTTFDHQLLSGLEIRKPFFMAGGISRENVAEVIRTIRPFAVDVSSKVETDGKKDPGKIEDFVKRVREENQR